MLFTSAAFLWLFLPIVLLVHTPLVRVSIRAANVFLLFASLLFYTWGSGSLVLLLGVSVSIDHLAANVAHRGVQQGNRTLIRGAVIASVIANVGLLSWFKYAGFLGRTLESISDQVGGPSFGVPEVVLPIGISFFTFQSMSYTFDVASGRLKPFRDPIRLLLYVSLFPQLIAGPIVRANDVAAEVASRRVNLDALSAGFTRFSWGLAKKMLIADSVAPLVDVAFAAPPTTASAWIAATGYAVQIYFDFSGYSDMAIGLGQMLGFTFPENFRRPYSAGTITDFWRRWHITLSSWFRDYVYIPAGGNRHGPAKTNRNLVIVFAITGLWHGAAWTFVLWGLWHGAALLIERSFNITAASSHPALRVWTVLVVLFGWVLFRAPDLTTAWSILEAMVIPTGGVPQDVATHITPLTVVSLAAGVVLSVMPQTFRPQDLLGERGLGPATVRFAVFAVALPLVAIRVLADTFTPFLYFQF